MTKERCAIYARVSLEEKTQYGLESQLVELKAAAKARGYALDPELEFRDDGLLGGNLERPALTALRQLTKPIEVLLVHDPDRLARKLSHQLLLVDEFEKRGIRLEFVTTSFENTPEGRMFFNMRGVFAEYEKEKIKDRTQRGRKQKARAGFIVGGMTPYGYRYLGKAQGERGRLVIEERQAIVVRQVFSWLVDDGCSLREITVRLNAAGWRPARSAKWAKSSVRRLVSNPTYSGVAYYNQRQRVPGQPYRLRAPEDWIAVAVPPIVAADVFMRALEALHQNAERLAGRNTVHVYPLRGLVRCGQCGRRYAGCPSHGRRYYRCMGRDRLYGATRCTGGLIPAAPLEAFVWSIVCEVLRRPDLLLEKLRTLDIVREATRDTRRTERDRVAGVITSLERKEAQLLDEYLETKFDRTLIERKAEELRQEKVRLLEEHGRLEREAAPARWPVDREARLHESCRIALRGLDWLDDRGRQQALTQLLDEIRVTGNEVHIHGILPGLDAPAIGNSAVVNRAKREHVASGLQPAFSLRSRLDQEPNIEQLELTV